MKNPEPVKGAKFNSMAHLLNTLTIFLAVGAAFGFKISKKG
jgi:hypothetical protein